MNPRRRQQARQRRKDREATYCAIQLHSVRDIAQLRRVRVGALQYSVTIYVRSMREWYRWDPTAGGKPRDQTILHVNRQGRLQSKPLH